MECSARALREYLPKLNMYVPLDLGNPLPGIYYREIFIHAGNAISTSVDIYSLFNVMYIYVNKRIFERIKRLLAVGTLKSWFEVRRILLTVTYFCTA